MEFNTLSACCVLTLAMIAILLPTREAQDEYLTLAQQQRQRCIHRAATPRSRRQWRKRRNRRSMLCTMHIAGARHANLAPLHSGLHRLPEPGRWRCTGLLMLSLLLWPSAASLYAMTSSALHQSMTVPLGNQHVTEVSGSLALSQDYMHPPYPLMSLAPDGVRACIPKCSMPLHVLSASYVSLGWQNAPSQQEHPLVLRALRQRWADVPETLFILPC